MTAAEAFDYVFRAAQMVGHALLMLAAVRHLPLRRAHIQAGAGAAGFRSDHGRGMRCPAIGASSSGILSSRRRLRLVLTDRRDGGGKP